TTANNQQTFAQTPQAVAASPGGKFVVTWSSQGQDGSGNGVYAQRYDPSGPVGGELQVNTTTTNDQEASAVAADANGNFVVTWQSDQNGVNWGIYAQRFDAAGRPLGGEFRVDAGSTYQDQFPSVGMDAGGNFVIVWQNNGQDGNSWGVYGQRYDSGGNPVGGTFQVNTYTANAQQHPEVAMAADGSFVVVWQSNNQDGNGWGVYGQRYDSAGNRAGGEFQVNTTTANAQMNPVVAIDPNHNFVVAWDANQTGDWDVYAQHYDASGNRLGGEFRVNTFTANDQRYPSVAADGYGNFEVTWSSQNQDGNGWGVYAQRYTAGGAPDGGEIPVNTYTDGDQLYSSIAAPAQTTSGPAPFQVVWSSQNQDGSGYGVYAQEYAASGITVSPTAITTTKAGGAATFSVVLDSQPAANVTVPVLSSNPVEGTVSTAVLTFTPSDWNVPQPVTVTGQNDFLPGNARYTISTGPAISTDPAYVGIDPADVSVTNVGPPAPGVTVSPTAGLETTEAGGSASFTIVLNTQPTGSVVIPISSSNTSAGTVSTPSVTFTPSSWNVAQTVTVTGADDHVVNGDTGYTIITGPAQSTDLRYNGIDPPDVSVTNQEEDVAGVVVAPASGLVTTELGGTAQFTVQLSSAPTAPVMIALGSSDATQGTPSVASLTFDATDWNTPQTVTVTGHDDHVVNGDQPYTINLAAASSADPVYDGGFATSVSLTNREEDVAGIGVTGDSFLVTENNKLERVNATTGAPGPSYATGTANGGVAVGPDGSMYQADSNHNQVVEYDPTGARVGRFGSGQLTFPQGLTFGPDGNLYVASADNTVKEFSPGGAFLGTFITAGSGGLSDPRGITWGPDGNVYVSSYANSEVLRYDGTTGAFLNVFATGTGGFEDLTFGPDGNLFVASYGDNAVYHFRGSDGSPLGALVRGGPLATPVGLRFDPAGNLDVSSQSLGTIQTYKGTTGAFVGNLVTGLTNPSYLVGPTSLVTSETGTTARFSLVLDTQPASDVTITLNSTMPGQGRLSTSSLTFTAASWNVAQTVTVTGLDDGLLNGDQVYSINGTAASGDTHYNGLTISPVVVVNQEADAATTTAVTSLANPSVYGQAVTFTATVSASGQGTPTGSVTFFDGTTNLGSVTLGGGSAVLTASGLSAGSHPITARYGGAPFFAASTSAALSQSVTPATLTVTANDASKVYGQPNPALSVSYSGFVNGDTTASLSGAPSLATTATAGSHAGTYAITPGPGTLSDPNYSFTF
ncbi:MAG TPA: Ig-like domain repeat protein, partial [Gemmataceae bacterium]|nr:Ig-like domain repeat protein [Gemmataceae bacterium]